MADSVYNNNIQNDTRAAAVEPTAAKGAVESKNSSNENISPIWEYLTFLFFEMMDLNNETSNIQSGMVVQINQVLVGKYLNGLKSAQALVSNAAYAIGKGSHAKSTLSNALKGETPGTPEYNRDSQALQLLKSAGSVSNLRDQIGVLSKKIDLAQNLVQTAQSFAETNKDAVSSIANKNSMLANLFMELLAVVKAAAGS